MSSAATSDGAGGSQDDGGGTRRNPATFWCHECDMSVSLLFSSPPLVCPHCRGDFLEEMEALHPRRSPSVRPRSRSLSPPHLHSAASAAAEELDPLPGFNHRDLLDFALRGGRLDSSSAAEDYYEVFDRLISYVVSQAPNNDGDQDDPTFSMDGDGGVPRPASKSSVEAIPTVQITEAFLAADPSLLCAVCKDEFALQTEARQLPCSHIYHADCILPWLSHHNSCPVCRFRLPTEDPGQRRRPATAEEPRVVFGNLLDEDRDDEVENTLRQIHRLLRSELPGRSGMGMEDTDALVVDGDFLAIGRILRRRRRRLTRRLTRLREHGAAVTSATQLAQIDMVSNGPANSAETVSSLWPIDEGTSVRESGAGSGGRIDEEGDVGIPAVRGLYN